MVTAPGCLRDPVRRILGVMRCVLLTTACLLLASCMPSAPKAPPDPLAPYRAALAGLSPEILVRAEAAPDRFDALVRVVRAAAAADPRLLARVDKEKPLPPDYEPGDLVSLTEYPFALARRDLRLRRPAAEAARELDAAAKAAGVTLVFSSAYRSYSYQSEVHARHVRELGQSGADRISARPGHSQHQLGTVVDFGSIDNTFAETKAGLWMAANAGRFGFSLSYPRGAEAVTGYDWESWHFRYIGKEAAALEAEFFGLQQWMLVFLERLLQNGLNP